jgi:hypothetical protein
MLAAGASAWPGTDIGRVSLDKGMPRNRVLVHREQILEPTIF